MRTEKLGQLLVDLGKITPDTLEEALRVQAEAAAGGHPDLKLGEVLVRLGVPEQVVLGALAFQASLLTCEIGTRPPASGALGHLGPSQWLLAEAFPLEASPDGIAVAIADPARVDWLERIIRPYVDVPLTARLAAPSDLAQALERLYPLGRRAAQRLCRALLEEERAEPASVPKDGTARLVGSSASLRTLIKSVFDQMGAGGVRKVLLTGPTGAGKELVARRVHEASGRKGPFVPVHLAALQESTLLSEIFGHEKGAYTARTGPARVAS